MLPRIVRSYKRTLRHITFAFAARHGRFAARHAAFLFPKRRLGGVNGRGFQPLSGLYACSDRIKTPVFRRCPLAPYVPLRFYPSESASAQAYNSSYGVTCRNPHVPYPAKHTIKLPQRPFLPFGAVIITTLESALRAFHLFF